MNQPPVIDFRIAPAKAVEELAELKAACARWLAAKDALERVRRSARGGGLGVMDLRLKYEREADRLEKVARRLEGM